MKLFFLGRRAHPVWGKFSDNKLPRYDSDAEGIHAKFDPTSILPHYNHIETSGFGCSAIINYRIGKNGRLKKYIFAVFPAIRMYPDFTRSSFSTEVKGLKFSTGKVKAERVDFDGILTLTGTSGGIEVRESISAAAKRRAVVFRYTVENKKGNIAEFTVKKPSNKTTPAFFAMDGKSKKVIYSAFIGGKEICGKEKIRLNAGEKVELLYAAGTEELSEKQIEQEFRMRRTFIEESGKRLHIETPEKEFDQMVDFCKIRASESIFETPGGLMHSPGGGNFYGAMWTNDECEYVNPLFAYLGYDKAREQSLNCYELFGRLAKEDEAIYTSIIACGNGYWHGAKDRGDNAMYLYGVSRYLMTTGDRQNTYALLPFIEKALRYQLSRFSEDDVLLSDSDELENRFLSGSANLSTQCIAYDAFISLSYLFEGIGKSDKAAEVRNAAQRVRRGIKNYFEAEVEGYDTYRYCKEEDKLRSWICLPLTVGIEDRKKGTVDALLSDKLFKDGGILTRSGEKTYWDRSALYAIKGLFIAQEKEKAYRLLKAYTEARLKGEHAPYPREAYPEGNAAHLSAESGLYLRIFIEGIIGYRPTGFDSFEIRPSLPDEWSYIRVKNICLCGKTTDIGITSENDKYNISIGKREFSIEKGKTLSVVF